MSIFIAKQARTVLLVGAALATLGIGGGAVAHASPVDASPPAIVDVDGTQGQFVPAVQGAQDDDGIQDAYLTNSVMVAPQTRVK
jgi:hypothetical protein